MLEFSEKDIELLNKNNIFFEFENKNAIMMYMEFFSKESFIKYLIDFKHDNYIIKMKVYISSVSFSPDKWRKITFMLSETNNRVKL